MRYLFPILFLLGISISSCNQAKDKYDPYNTETSNDSTEITNSSYFEIDFKKTEANVKNIHVKLNDSNGYDALFDTGCSGMMISSLELIELIKSGTLTKDDYVGESTVSLADGSVITHPVYNIRSVSVTDKNGTVHTLNDIYATVAENPGADVIIGNAVIDNLAKNSYTVDLKNKVIKFE